MAFFDTRSPEIATPEGFEFWVSHEGRRRRVRVASEAIAGVPVDAIAPAALFRLARSTYAAIAAEAAAKGPAPGEVIIVGREDIQAWLSKTKAMIG